MKRCRGLYRSKSVDNVLLARRSSALWDSAAIAALAAICFLPWLGRLHLFDWDEINFAEAAREMLVTANYRDVQIGFLPFSEKPPLFMWVQAISMQLFGVGEFAARLPNAVVGIVTLVGIYLLGRRLADRVFGLWWAVAFGCSMLPNLYFRSGIIDPVFNLLVFAGTAALFEYDSKRSDDEQPHQAFLFISGLCIGLAVLTKGPVALLLPGLSWLAVAAVRKSVRATIVPMILWASIACVVAAPWYLAVARASARGSGNFISAFVARQIELARSGVAGHSGPWYFHVVVLVLGCFPASVFAIPALSRSGRSPRAHDFRLWMISLLVVVVVVFSLVQTKIVHYSSLAYFPITFLAAATLSDLQRAWPRYITAAAVVIGVIWAAIFLALPIAGLSIAYGWLDPARLTHDVFVRATLAANVGWSLLDFCAGAIFLVAAVVAVFVTQRDGRNPRRFAGILFAAMAFAVPCALALIAPKVERYTQATPIAFYRSLRGCDCYVAPLGFKSYAHLFYARVLPEHSARRAGVAADGFQDWLVSGPIDRPAYFVARLDKSDEWRKRPGMNFIGERDGFVFLRRDPRP